MRGRAQRRRGSCVGLASQQIRLGCTLRSVQFAKSFRLGEPTRPDRPESRSHFRTRTEGTLNTTRGQNVNQHARNTPNPRLRLLVNHSKRARTTGFPRNPHSRIRRFSIFQSGHSSAPSVRNSHREPAHQTQWRNHRPSAKPGPFP